MDSWSGLPIGSCPKTATITATCVAMVYLYWVRPDKTRENGDPRSFPSAFEARAATHRVFALSRFSYICAEIVDPQTGRIIETIQNRFFEYPEVSQ